MATTPIQKKYRNKTKKIKELVNFNFKNLVEQKKFNGETRNFLIGESSPLSSFSRWSNPLFEFKFELIPKFVINKVAKIGSDLMQSLEHYTVFGDFNNYEFENEKTKNLAHKLIFILTMNNFKIVECEKYFINVDYHMAGYVDLIVYDQTNKQYILLEIKTRNKDNIKVDNITRAQAFFYKLSFNNIKTMILIIERDNPEHYILETLNYHKGLEPFNIIKSYWNLIK